MKDLEKIKSEDLAAQVQDANPANFAIEQEVAQLVGATVPAPTEPSADDARELGAQLLVFLRRALTPIQTALRTDLAAIYAHLDSRCTAYTPAAYASYMPLPSYDPMGTPPTPRTLPNLLQALTAFSARKISNGSATADGIPDGMSLVHLLCETSAWSAITKLIDDNKGWVMDKVLSKQGLSHIRLGCSLIPSGSLGTLISDSASETIEFPYLETMYNQGRDRIPTFNAPNAKLYFDSLVNLYGGTMYNSQFGYIADAKEVIAPKLSNVNNGTVANSENIERMVFGTITHWYNYTGNDGKFQFGYGCPNLIDVELGQGTAVSIAMPAWNPTNVLADADKTATFLQNFREHIALRLTSNGSGKTLTLSQAVRDAIHAAEATYGIEAIIVTQKGWTLSPAPGASSQ